LEKGVGEKEKGQEILVYNLRSYIAKTIDKIISNYLGQFRIRVKEVERRVASFSAHQRD
jgi:hypothetical protein